MNNKKFLSILLIVIFLMSIFSGCTKNKKELILGTFENNKYSNDYFGFTMELPEDWHIATDEEKKALFNVGKEMLVENNEDLVENTDSSSEGIFHLVWTYKYPLNSVEDFNPNFLCTAENVGLIDSIIIDEKDYIESVKTVLEETGVGYKCGDISTEKIGNKDFYVMEVSLDYQGITIYQKYYLKIVDKYVLSYLLSYSSEDEKNELTDILNTISFEE
ncbi:hypothetical protein [Defluviitalea phaphyphila]|uniref:hypothetical protein n=1 Tax=Defluviitalea phaphyphila TaxID=1473580 RepID=UPI00073118C7|nr:hypothetical protein [Defluviitalea phaphyphila]